MQIKNYVKLAAKILLSVAFAYALFACAIATFIIYIITARFPFYMLLSAILLITLTVLLWCERFRKKILIISGSIILVLCIPYGIFTGVRLYEESKTIDVTPNINVDEYLPFEEDSRIVKIRSQTLSLTKDLPRIDGATAAFPVYSAFVNAVYPETTRLYDDAFQYNNTVGGYRKLAERKTDIFLGAAPSKEQLEYAEKYGTVFEYTQIGTEAFVFFVHKDNPVDSLTVEQIKGIYSGEITNWKEVGGNDERIVPFQRNEGSGSQSMMLRFMGDTPLVEPEKKEIVSTMGGVIERVADYKSKSGSIGYSFRFYIEGIIKNPEIKMIAIDGVAPTVDNIKNNTYPIVTPVYAVTYENNPNKNVDALVQWMLSDEGQYIIEQTGYVGIR